MPFPIVIKPLFPNVPSAPGVPALLRSAAGRVDVLTGSIQGKLDPLSNIFTGNIAGILTQASGQVSAVVSTIQGVLDGANNFSGVLSGAIGGRLVGTLSGVVDRVNGVIQGTLSGVVNQLRGVLPGFLSSALGLPGKATPFKWGIFDSGGKAMLTADNVVGLDYALDYKVSTFPIERGYFESYNKVETPFDVRVVFTKGGTVAERASFLAAAESLVSSRDLYSVATPEFTYTDVSAVHLDYDRTAQSGATLLKVTIGLQRIRAYATATFTSTKTPDGAADANTGPVQAVTPTPPQNAAIDSALAGAPVDPVVGS